MKGYTTTNRSFVHIDDVLVLIEKHLVYLGMKQRISKRIYGHKFALHGVHPRKFAILMSTRLAYGHNNLPHLMRHVTCSVSELPELLLLEERLGKNGNVVWAIRHPNEVVCDCPKRELFIATTKDKDNTVVYIHLTVRGDDSHYLTYTYDNGEYVTEYRDFFLEFWEETPYEDMLPFDVARTLAIEFEAQVSQVFRAAQRIPYVLADHFADLMLARHARNNGYVKLSKKQVERLGLGNSGYGCTNGWYPLYEVLEAKGRRDE